MNKQEYIDRTVTIEKIKAIYCADCNNYNEVRCRACLIDDALNCIDDAPAADVAPVVHGEWKPNGMHPNGVVGNWKCSVCEKRSLEDSNFCPNCGAKMDEEEKHER